MLDYIRGSRNKVAAISPSDLLDYDKSVVIRLIVMALMLLAAVNAQDSAATSERGPKATIEGKLRRTGKSPITLTLTAARSNRNSCAEYNVEAAANGSYQFNSVEPGVYTLLADSNDIVATEYGALEAGMRGKPIVVEPGAHIRNLNFAPPRLSAICGRIADREGPWKATGLISLLHQGEPERWWEAVTPVVVKPDGRFRVSGVIPRVYFFAYTFNVDWLVYFSSDGTVGTAAPVRVQAGKDIGCGKDAALVLHGPPNPATSYSFGGKVSGDLPEIMGDRFTAILRHVRRGPQIFLARANLDAERRFSFDNVPGGTFQLEVRSAYGPEPIIWSGAYAPVSHLLASQVIHVDESLKELSIAPMQLPMVTGAVHFNHLPSRWHDINLEPALWAQSANHVPLTLKLRPLDGSVPSSAQLAKDGSFTLGPEDAGDYEVSFSDLPQPTPLYVREIRLDGRQIRGRYFHLGNAATAHLDIEVDGDSGEIKARILTEQPAAETCSKLAAPKFVVILLPDPPLAGSPLLTRLFYRETPNFQILGVAPGHYRLLAAQVPGITGAFSRTDSPSERDEFQQALRNAVVALGVSVTVQAGSTVVLELPDRTLDAVRIAAGLGAPLDSTLLDW
jgi:hypothetical protein